VEISDGGLLPSRLSDYGEKAALPAVLDVSADTEYVDVTLSYDDGDLQREADESTLAREDRMTVNATVENVGGANGSTTLTYRAGGITYGTESVSLDAGESTTVAFTLAGSVTTGFPTGDLTHGIYALDDAAAATLTVANASVDGPGTLGSGLGTPTDPDGDGRYEDVTGDGQVDVIDVAEFLDRFGSVPSGDVAFFDFNGDGGIDIVDVAELLAET